MRGWVSEMGVMAPLWIMESVISCKYLYMHIANVLCLGQLINSKVSCLFHGLWFFPMNLFGLCKDSRLKNHSNCC